MTMKTEATMTDRAAQTPSAGRVETHPWPRWYAGYIVARERGRTPDEAASDAALQVDRRST